MYSILNTKLETLASQASRKANGRIQNWVRPRPTIKDAKMGEYETLNAGRYRGNYKGYTVWNKSFLTAT